MRGRMIALVALLLGSAATSCITSSGIAVAPPPTVQVDSAAQTAFALVARVTTQRGLKAYTPRDQQEEGWNKCFSEEKLFLCGKVKDREIQFRLFETMARQYTPRADSLRRELLDSLRARFGERSVRECTWQHEHDLRRSGCAASSQGDGR